MAAQSLRRKCNLVMYREYPRSKSIHQVVSQDPLSKVAQQYSLLCVVPLSETAMQLTRRYLLCLEEQDGAVAEVEVYEVLGFCQRPELALRLLRNNAAAVSPRDRCQGPGEHTVGDEASKIAADNAVPCRTLTLVERLLDVLRNILPSVIVS